MNSDRIRATELRAAAAAAKTAAPAPIACLALALAAVGATVLAGTISACSGPCCTVDGFPIELLPTAGKPAGGLVGRGRDDSGTAMTIALDTGSPLTFVRGQADGSAHMTRRSFDILGATAVAPNGTYPLRASFRGIAVLPVTLDPAGADIVLGADLLRAFSVQIDFGAPSVTLWSGQRAPDSFLGAPQCAGSATSPTCFAVLHFSLLGGGELTAVSEPDFLGLTGPVEFPATRVLLRACAASFSADPVNDQDEPLCCTRSDATHVPAAPAPGQLGYAPTGTDLALVVASGIGPTVLAESAWTLIAANWKRLPGATPLPEPAAGRPVSFPWLPTPLSGVMWSKLPRLALVDLESDPATNPGACIELARARRLEWIEQHRAAGIPACTQTCDTDVREPSKAQNAAGYLELGSTVDVAIIPDGAAVLQTVRAELRQQGPQVDGFLGTDVLAPTTMEIDYGASPARVVFACLPGRERATCLASPRCVRQASVGEVHSCFGLPPLARPDPSTCAPSVCP